MRLLVSIPTCFFFLVVLVWWDGLVDIIVLIMLYRLLFCKCRFDIFLLQVFVYISIADQAVDFSSLLFFSCMILF